MMKIRRENKAVAAGLVFLFLIGACQKAATVPRAVSTIFDFGNDFAGYRKTEGPTIYTRKNLYDYVDGGAEAYLSLGFRELLSFELLKNGDEAIKFSVDIYDMGSTGSASKIYESEKAKSEITLPGGLNGSISDNFLSFCRNIYYVKIIAFSPVKGDILLGISDLILKRLE